MPNRDHVQSFDPGPSFLIENTPDYPRAVEELYCAALTAGSDRRTLAAATLEISDRYGFEGDQPQTMLVDVVASLVCLIRQSVSLETRVEFEAAIAERAAVARLADDLENFEDGVS